MKQRSTAGVDHEMPALTPDAAWKLWHQLVDLTNSLWDAFEQEFIEFSIQESEKEDFNRPLPFD